MDPITGVEIEGVHDRCMREPINLADDDHTHDTLDAVVAPAMRGLPPHHACQAVFEQLVAVLIMGLGIGARVIEERTLALEKDDILETE
jgi:hypothetical protein